MIQNTFNDDVRSFVSFALAMKPTISLSEREGGNAVELQFTGDKNLSSHQTSSLETLMEKYEKIKQFLPSQATLETLEIRDIKPQISFEPDTKYQIVSIEAEQLNLAKDIAKRIESIHNAYHSGDSTVAHEMYNELDSVLSKKRAELVGGFLEVPEIDAVTGAHAVGRNSDPQALGGGVIFVIIEVYVST